MPTGSQIATLAKQVEQLKPSPPTRHIADRSGELYRFRRSLNPIDPPNHVVNA
jgi:hypothetical protein